MDQSSLTTLYVQGMKLISILTFPPKKGLMIITFPPKRVADHHFSPKKGLLIITFPPKRAADHHFSPLPLPAGVGVYAPRACSQICGYRHTHKSQNREGIQILHQ